MACCVLMASLIAALLAIFGVLRGRSKNSAVRWRLSEQSAETVEQGEATTGLLKSRLLSFKYAAEGIIHALRTERNLQIQALIALAVIAAALYWRLSVEEWRWLVVAMVMVGAAELMNSALEYVCDLVNPEVHPLVRRAKDMAAGAVLVCALGAAAIGLMTFWPYLCRTFC